MYINISRSQFILATYYIQLSGRKLNDIAAASSCENSTYKCYQQSVYINPLSHQLITSPFKIDV